MTIIIATQPEAGPEAPKAEAPAKKKSGRPTKAELLEECAALGIEASPNMTNPELYALVSEAKGK